MNADVCRKQRGLKGGTQEPKQTYSLPAEEEIDILYLIQSPIKHKKRVTLIINTYIILYTKRPKALSMV